MGVSGSSDENDSWGDSPSGSAGLPVENKGDQAESSRGAAAAEIIMSFNAWNEYKARRVSALPLINWSTATPALALARVNQ
jgi:hypothetical protein